MSIDEKLKNMKPSDTPLLVVGYVLLGMMLLLGLPAQAQDNEVLIDAVENYVRIGDFVQIKITEAREFDLIGKVV